MTNEIEICQKLVPLVFPDVLRFLINVLKRTYIIDQVMLDTLFLDNVVLSTICNTMFFPAEPFVYNKIGAIKKTDLMTKAPDVLPAADERKLHDRTPSFTL